MCKKQIKEILVVGNFPTTSLTGHQVTTAGDYDEGIEILEKENFDLIIIGAVEDTTKSNEFGQLAGAKQCLMFDVSQTTSHLGLFPRRALSVLAANILKAP